MKCKNGDVMIGTWDKDRMNGVFCIKNKQGEKMVLFKEGMKIDLTYDVTFNDYLYYILSFILMCTFWAGIPAGLLIEEGYFGLMGSFVIYIIYSCNTDSCKYLDNLVELNHTFKNIAAAIQSAPDCGFHIQCYHYETRHYKDSKGNSKTRRVRVNTHSASQVFHAQNFVD